ncbi:unnamed protein product [Rotaria socialis]|uniref:Uncharacterized protein n=2 Tax=Rotaria socialis TaxID=392032 RepID=A0A821RA55_9BILA|nr:unnamed protein product [Rotaria socialis]
MESHFARSYIPNKYIQACVHSFRVFFLEQEKSLDRKKYELWADLLEDVFQLFKDVDINKDNVILTQRDDNNKERLLTSVPKLLEEGHYGTIYIKCVHPVCAMCLNPFGILDKQLPLECPQVKCDEQYCGDCVQAIRGIDNKYPFTCMVCKGSTIPRRNELIEEHLIWKHFGKLYGTENFLAFKSKLELDSYSDIVNDIRLRRNHLQSRINTFEKKRKSSDSTDPSNNNLQNSDSKDPLIQDVANMIIELDKLIIELENIGSCMDEHATIIDECLAAYQDRLKHFDKLCEALSKEIKLTETNTRCISIKIADSQQQQTQDIYHMNDLCKLLPQQNVANIDKILADIMFRKKTIEPYLASLDLFLEDQPQNITTFNSSICNAKEMLKAICETQEKLQFLRGNLRAIERCIDQYGDYLADDRLKHIPCSKFILLLENLRVKTERLDIKANFSKVISLNEIWQNSHSSEEQFKPKVIELFKAVELDLAQIFYNRNYIRSIPFKVGVIGDGCVGKSTLIGKLSECVDQSVSTVASGRSTFGYLQIDTFINECPHKTIPITFIDLEGAIDTNNAVFIGNYKELIKKADCDLYLLVFHGSFDDDLHGGWHKYIKEELQRDCLLVRNKVDRLFLDLFKERKKQDYTPKLNSRYLTDCIIRDLRKQVGFTKTRKSLSDTVYLTAAACDTVLATEDFAKFDIDELKKTIILMATKNTRVARIRDLAVLAVINTINTCFRRAYVVSKLKYQVLATLSSFIPFADEVPVYFGQEKIRQVFGIHDNMWITNCFKRKKDSLQEYLSKYPLMVSESELQSGCFTYLANSTTEESSQRIGIEARKYIQAKEMNRNNMISSIGRKIEPCLNTTAITLGALGKISDDALRTAGVATSGAVRALSITGIAAGAALIPICAAWSYY